ncbi:hypothetical protein [Hyalangium sp.]|nr:hypothetical protein [Hyalangium sp.]HYH96413.1 hypothetical protein [Hyalangium sp.]
MASLQKAAPLEGRTAECEAVLYGELGYADETLFLYASTARYA